GPPWSRAGARGSSAAAGASTPRSTTAASPPRTRSTALKHESFMRPFLTVAIFSPIVVTDARTGTSTHDRSAGTFTVVALPSRLTSSDAIWLFPANSLALFHTPAAIFSAPTRVGAAITIEMPSPTPSSGLPSHHAVDGTKSWGSSAATALPYRITRHGA